MRVTVDRALFQEIKEGIIALRQLQSNPRRRQIHFIEHRCECSGRFVITLEELPFEDASRAEFRYVIGNGKDIRFVFSSIDDLEKLCWDLEHHRVIRYAGVGIPLLIVGRRMAIRTFICHCGNEMTKDTKICPRCGAHFP